MSPIHRLAAGCAALLLPAAMPASAAAPAPAALAGSTAAHDRLFALFAASDEAMLKRNPMMALYRGDLRYADRLGVSLSDAHIDEERHAARADLAALRAIDRAGLSATDRIAYDVFQFQTEEALKALAPEVLALTVVRPIDHFYGLQVYYPDLASGQGAAPFKTLLDYENNLKRHREYIAWFDEAIGRFRQGLATGIVQPRLVVDNIVAQLDLQIAQGVEGSTFYGPVKAFPPSIPAADRARLTKRYAAIIRDGIIPAETRLRDFLKTDYRPAARDSVGLSGMTGGDKLYALAIEQNTTLPLTADHVHSLGLSEVARIRAQLEAIQRQVGFTGTLRQFFDHLRTDPSFQPKTREQVRDGYAAIGRRVDARIPGQFSVVPKSRLEIRPVPAYREKGDAGGSYQQGTPDGSRPGIFFYNSYDLPSRSLWGMETLYLHEAIPGHHFQISIAQEDAALPAFMRFGGNTAFVEGWALYAESLWHELGMETDPYQRFGGLNDEMLRAMRLVVDTGIHAKGWGRDKAIAYMLDNSGMGVSDATAEVERYIAIPGQALAYKIGQLTIARLKAKAQAALGARFDPRAFHAQVLDTGALPMTVLEAKIDRWIEATKG